MSHGPVTTYADHAADTPVRPGAAALLTKLLGEVGNASAAHVAGQGVRIHVEQSRDAVAEAVGCAPADVVFTSGGTEADNLAVKGIVWAARADRAGPGAGPASHVVSTSIEHPAVLEPLRWLAGWGDIELTLVDPGPDGVVRPHEVLAAVRDDTVLVSVMAANNVVGAVNDVAMIGRGLADHPAAFHVDAVQAMHLVVRADDWGVDALALSAHKFGGPPGIGCAVLRRGVAVQPLMHGGGQDRGVRSGSMPAAMIASLGASVVEVLATREQEAAMLRSLTDVVREAVGSLDGVTVLGPDDPARRLPGLVSLALDGVQPDALMFELDRAGVRASVGAACASGATGANPVLEAMGVAADAGLRLSFGWSSTPDDASRVAEVVTDVLPRLRAAGGGFLA